MLPVATLVLAGVGLAPDAWAQAAAGGPPKDAAPAAADPVPADAAPSDPAPADAGPADTAPADPGAKTDAGAASKAPDVAAPGMDLYGVSDEGVPLGSRIEWAKRREIRIIQKRAVLKEGRFGVSLLAGVVPNDDFWTYVTPGLGVQYYFSEDLALSVHGAYAADKATSLRDGLEDPRPYGPGLIVRLPQTLNAWASAGLDWNLIHGKVGFFGTGLIEFDGALTFGVGAVRTNIQDLAKPVVAQIDPAGNVGAQVQFYLTNSFSLRLDFHQFFYAKLANHPGSGGVSHPLAVGLSFTYMTAGVQ